MQQFNILPLNVKDGSWPPQQSFMEAVLKLGNKFNDSDYKSENETIGFHKQELEEMYCING